MRDLLKWHNGIKKWGYMMISAVLDANVLYSASLRNLLLCFAERRLFCPVWSEEIHDEWMRNLLRNRPDLKRENIERTRRKMDFHFPNSLVRGYEPIITTLTLPDPNDRHILAVAIHAKAKYIVTFDLNHFPSTILLPYKIEAMSPEEFVLQLIGLAPLPVLEAVKKHRLSLTRPPKTVDEYLATLERQGLAKTAAFLRKQKDSI